MSDAEAFAVVSGFSRLAEDNGAWLVALGSMSEGDQTVVSPAGEFAGGKTTAIALAFSRALLLLLNPSRTGALQENGTVLLFSHILLALIYSVLAYMAVVAICRSSSRGVSVALGLITPISVTFAFSLTAIGHFSAVTAMVLVMGAIAATVGAGTAAIPAVTVTTALMLFSAGEAWFVFTGIFILYAVLTGVQWLIRNKSSSRRRHSLRVCALAIVVFLFVRLLLFGYITTVLDWDYLLSQLRLTGGYSEIRLEIVVVTFLLAAVWLFRERTPSSARNLVAATVIPFFILIVLSYAVSPYAPRYGVMKFMFIVTAVLVPMAYVTVVDKVTVSLSGLEVGSVACLMILFFALIAPPGASWNWLHNTPYGLNTWAQPVVEVSKSDTERVVGCVTVKADGTPLNSVHSYVCSRLAFGLHAQDTSAHRVWTAGNICQIGPKQAAAELTPSFYKNLTVIVTVLPEGTNPCGDITPETPAGWLTDVPWESIRTVDEGGNEISVPIPIVP